MSSLDEIKEMFFVECDEQLEALADGLAELETGDAISETVNTMFRAVHSVKGGAASFNLDALTQFAHAFEFVLDDLRSERISVTPEVVRHLYKAADHLAALISDGGNGESFNSEQLEAMITEIGALATSEIPTENEADELVFEPMQLDFEAPDIRIFDIIFRPSQKLYDLGHDPVHLFRELAGMGELRSVPDIPKNLDSELLSWVLELETDSKLEEVAEVFEFIDGLAELNLTVRQEENQGDDLPDIPLPAVPDPAPGATEDALKTEVGTSSPHKPPTTKPTLRVDLGLVDNLINLVGELVINQSVLSQATYNLQSDSGARVGQSLEELKNLTRQIQECVMSLRAQSVKTLFQRMARIVRETADVSGKDVHFELDGESTEVDRTVIEHLVDPLTHILRNSIDHGLESPEVRVMNGKEPSGNVRLSAQHRSGRVVIEVTDDGGGIDRKRVLAKAIEKGMVPDNAKLSDQEIDRLLFAPGFSTAESVTSLSGRGVGMDVVNKEIQKLGGRIAISSEAGQGTSLTISLPLTLAVLDGMVVDVAGQTMVVPLSAIFETIRPRAGQIHRVEPGKSMIRIRDVLVPVIDLSVMFGYPRETPADIFSQVLLLTESAEQERRALIVDRIYDQRQVVIKSLENNYGQVAGVSAATILGDGKIALIIDPDEIVNIDAVKIPSTQLEAMQ